jgi:hypothetical protein
MWQHCSWTSLCVDSILRSGSGAPGETVAVETANGVIRVEVTDLSEPGVPEPHRGGSDAEAGRGFISLPALPRGGGGGGRTVTWFEIQGG